MNQPIPPSLHFYWYETNASTKTAEYWRQLVGSTHRLMFIAEQLELLHKEQDINTVVDSLQYHVENYLVRIYELRERVFKLITAITRDEKTVNNLRYLDKRHDALILLRAKITLLANDEKIIDLLEDLLIFLDEDVLLHYRNTHEYFLRLGLWDDYNFYEPQDVLINIQNDSENKSKFEIILWQAIRSIIEYYQIKINQVIQLAIKFLEEVENKISFDS